MYFLNYQITANTLNRCLKYLYSFYAETSIPLVKSGLLGPSDAPNLSQALSFAFLTAVTFLPNVH